MNVTETLKAARALIAQSATGKGASQLKVSPTLGLIAMILRRSHEHI